MPLILFGLFNPGNGCYVDALFSQFLGFFPGRFAIDPALFGFALVNFPGFFGKAGPHIFVGAFNFFPEFA